MVVAAVVILTMTGRAATTRPWQKSPGDHDRHGQRHDASWSLHNRHDSISAHPANYAETGGQISDYDRPHGWRYGDGGFWSSFDRTNCWRADQQITGRLGV